MRSYFTKPFAVEHLISHAVEPTLEAHLDRVRELLTAGRRVDAAEKVFDFRVADIAMGSGHFLTAVVDHLEARYMRFLDDKTSSQLLYALRNDSSMRRAIGGAEVVTFNIGINDLGQASRSYENGACGGAENDRGLRAAVEEVEENWDAIIEVILSLRSTQETIIRTAGLEYTPRGDRVFEPYLDEVNRHIAASAAENSIPHAEVHLGREGMSSDGVHPNDEGYGVIAASLRDLGYEPLSPS